MTDQRTFFLNTPVCRVCRKSNMVALTADEANALTSGAHIQDALPNRDDDFRELFISGTHSDCWDTLFGSDEDEEDDEDSEYWNNSAMFAAEFAAGEEDLVAEAKEREQAAALAAESERPWSDEH